MTRPRRPRQFSFEEALANCKRIRGELPPELKEQVAAAFRAKHFEPDLAKLIANLALLDDLRSLVRPGVRLPTFLRGYATTLRAAKSQVVQMQAFARSHPKSMKVRSRPKRQPTGAPRKGIDPESAIRRDLPSALPAGTSQLEAIQKEPQVIKRIADLARAKDDPDAWRDLACGYRVKRLRRPLEKAMREVGTEKILNLIRKRPGFWPPEVVAFLEDEEKKQEQALLATRNNPNVEIQFPPWW
jgi:hypothetical protein